jgi:hypothetical protein
LLAQYGTHKCILLVVCGVQCVEACGLVTGLLTNNGHPSVTADDAAVANGVSLSLRVALAVIFAGTDRISFVNLEQILS